MIILDGKTLYVFPETLGIKIDPLNYLEETENSFGVFYHPAAEMPYFMNFFESAVRPEFELEDTVKNALKRKTACQVLDGMHVNQAIFAVPKSTNKPVYLVSVNSETVDTANMTRFPAGKIEIAGTSFHSDMVTGALDALDYDVKKVIRALRPRVRAMHKKAFVYKITEKKGIRTVKYTGRF